MKRKRNLEVWLIVLMSLAMVVMVAWAVIAAIRENVEDDILEPKFTDGTLASTPSDDVPKQSKTLYIGFSSAETEDAAFETMDMIEAKKLEMYSSKYADFNSYVYYQSLRGNEKIIYNALQRALDESCQYIWIDNELRMGNEYAADDILRFPSLDSAVLEQNLVFTMTNDKKGGYRIWIENFSAEKTEKKEEAISKAREVFRQMDQNLLTNTEKAQYFYDYLGKNVTYVSIGDRDKKDVHFLYEALCMGQTNCDGFTNAFSLLCNMAGIPCFEKMYLPGDEEGHTWNTLMLDGCWYNVDTTGAEEDVTDDYLLMRSLRRCFGYSDSLQTNIPMYDEMIPSCERDLVPISCRFQTTEDLGICEAIKEAYAATTQKYVVISFEKGSAEGPLLQQIADALGCDIHREIRTGVGEQTIWYLFNAEGL